MPTPQRQRTTNGRQPGRPRPVVRRPPSRPAAPPASEQEPGEAKGLPPAPFVIVRSEAETHYFKGMFFGAYGAGKTTLAATSVDVPEMNDIIVADIEGGTLVLPTGTDVVRIRSYAELARFMEYLRLHCQLRDAGNEQRLAEHEANLRGEEVTEPKHYYTAIVDSLSEAQQFLMYQILSIDYVRQPVDYEPEAPEGKDWQRGSDMLQMFVRKMRDLPMHVIFVCGEQEVEVGKGDNKRLLKRPALPGKLGTKVQGFLNVVGYLETRMANDKTTRRRLWLQAGHPAFQAKMRVRKELQATAPKYMDEPTMGELLELSRRFAPMKQGETESDASTEDTYEEEFDDELEPAPSPRPAARRPVPQAAARARAGAGRAGRRRG